MKKYLIALMLGLVTYTGLIYKPMLARAASFTVSQICGYPTTNTVQSGISGSTTNPFYPGSVTFYCGTTNTNIWYFTNSYTTNIIMTNGVGVGLYPNATNQVTGTSAGATVTNTIYTAGWGRDVQIWPDQNAQVNTNVSIAVTYQGNTSVTNLPIVFTFVRSPDGVNFDLALDTFAFQITPASPFTNVTTLVTNIPPVFLAGSRLIRLHSVYFPSNLVTTANFTLDSVSVNGWTP